MYYLYYMTNELNSMKYFLRFTETAIEDLERGTSLLDLPSLNKPVILKGLCGFSFCEFEDIEYGILSDSEIEDKVKMFKNNVFYKGIAVLFLGEYLEQNSNGEGVIFKAIEIHKYY